jgi:hypothetical protein
MNPIWYNASPLPVEKNKNLLCKNSVQVMRNKAKKIKITDLL